MAPSVARTVQALRGIRDSYGVVRSDSQGVVPGAHALGLAERSTNGALLPKRLSPELQEPLVASRSMIEVIGVTKSYGDKVAVSDLSFEVRPGIVTGFLGPNGSGKSTTMRLILGLDDPDAGQTYVNGKRYRDHRAPLHQVGALLEASRSTPAAPPTTTSWPSPRPTGSAAKRVSELIEAVGLEEVAKKRAGSFSLGMGQRLGIASALLGDPRVVMLDEPVNGLDPEGILWVRNLLKRLAAEGRTVFVSSHLMSEMALTAEHLIVIGRGELIADMGVEELVRGASSAPCGCVRRRPPGWRSWSGRRASRSGPSSPR